MKNELKIAVIVVTYNRKDLLPQCLDGILKQTKKVDCIFLIDNASIDGTENMVQKEYAENNVIQYIRLNSNTGSAGGFHEGCKQAYEWGADWIWFLDDDVAPDVECLEKLLQFQEVSKCIHPRKYDLNGKEFIWENTYDPSMLRVSIFNDNISFKNGKEYVAVSIGCFEGMLIHREIVEKIGFPDPRFFTAGDDTAYGFLASLHTTVIFVRDAYITKLLPLTGKISPMYMYYATRNLFLLKEDSQKFKLFKARLFYPYLFLFAGYASLKQTFRNGSPKTLWYIWKGVIHGLQGRFYKL